MHGAREAYEPALDEALMLAGIVIVEHHLSARWSAAADAVGQGTHRGWAPGLSDHLQAGCIERGDIGTLAPGMLADLVIVDGDPLELIFNLLKVEVVLKGGEIVADHRR